MEKRYNMLKFNEKYYFFYFVCIFTLFALTGCTQSKNNLINTDSLGKLINDSYDTQTSSHEMVKLKNGVVIYKDNTTTNTPSGYSGVNFSPAKPIHFGPSEINFSPKKVNPK
jgi:hypothetical protein